MESGKASYMVHSFCAKKERLELRGRLRPQERPESFELLETPAKSGWLSISFSEAVGGSNETSSVLADTRAEAADASIFSRHAIVASEEEGEPPCHIVAGIFRVVGVAEAAGAAGVAGALVAAGAAGFVVAVGIVGGAIASCDPEHPSAAPVLQLLVEELRHPASGPRCPCIRWPS